jgi:hypothetical protein
MKIWEKKKEKDTPWIFNPPKGSNFRARKIQKFRETHAEYPSAFRGKESTSKYDYIMNAGTVSMGLTVSLIAIANNYELRRPPQFLEMYL